MFIKPVQKRLKGFTLIELLVVIAILGILAAAVLVAINPAKRTRQAQDSKRKNDIGALATEVQGYYTSPGMGAYPTSVEVLTAEGYMKQVPFDPTNNTMRYLYMTNAVSPTEISLYATLASPTGAGSRVWCYQTSSGIAQELTNTACTP